MLTDTQLQKPFRGIIPPMVTPLLDNNTIDKEGLYNLIEHIINGGVRGLFILGTTGEAISLTDKLKKEFIRLTCEHVKGRIPIMVGITDSSPGESISLATFAAKAGVSAVVAAPPFYFNLTQKELLIYFKDLADKSPLPLYLYNLPTQTKIMIEPETVKELSTHPNIIGVKDSSGNAVYFNTILYCMKDDPSFTILVGPDEMLASTALIGGHGGVNSGANIFPRLFVDLYNATQKGDYKQVLQLQEIVMLISDRIYNAVRTNTSYLKGLKASLAAMGICSGFVASPLKMYEGNDREIIKDNLKFIENKIKPEIEKA